MRLAIPLDVNKLQAQSEAVALLGCVGYQSWRACSERSFSRACAADGGDAGHVITASLPPAHHIATSGARLPRCS